MKLTDQRRLAAVCLLGLSLLGCSEVEKTRPIRLIATPVPLDPTDPGKTHAGRLRYLAGFQLTSDDGGFGGFSGLAIDLEGRWLTAISDRGRWWTAELHHAADGTLTGFGEARLGLLLDFDGEPVFGPYRRDAEELVALPEGGFVVAFEGTHRLARYPLASSGVPAPDGVPQPFPFPEGIAAADANSGMETVARLADGRWLVLSQGLETPAGDYLGWLGEPDGGGWQALALAASLKLHPTGAAVLPTGELAVLERSDSPERGPHVRLVLIEPETIQPGARLDGPSPAFLQAPLNVENFESLAARPGPDGAVLLYLLSDDNFDARQRTLLLQFELELAPQQLAAGTPVVGIPAEPPTGSR